MSASVRFRLCFAIAICIAICAGGIARADDPMPTDASVQIVVNNGKPSAPTDPNEKIINVNVPSGTKAQAEFLEQLQKKFPKKQYDAVKKAIDERAQAEDKDGNTGRAADTAADPSYGSADSRTSEFRPLPSNPQILSSPDDAVNRTVIIRGGGFFPVVPSGQAGPRVLDGGGVGVAGESSSGSGDFSTGAAYRPEISGGMNKKIAEENTRTAELHPVVGGGAPPAYDGGATSSSGSDSAADPAGTPAVVSGAPGETPAESAGRLKAESMAERVLNEIGTSDATPKPARIEAAVKGLLKYFDPAKDGQLSPGVVQPAGGAASPTQPDAGATPKLDGIKLERLLPIGDQEKSGETKRAAPTLAGVPTSLFAIQETAPGKTGTAPAIASGEANLPPGEVILGGIGKPTVRGGSRIGRLLTELIAWLRGKKSFKQVVAGLGKKAADKFKAPSRAAAAIMVERATAATGRTPAVDEPDEEELARTGAWLGALAGTVFTLLLVGLVTWARRKLRKRPEGAAGPRAREAKHEVAA